MLNALCLVLELTVVESTLCFMGCWVWSCHSSVQTLSLISHCVFNHHSYCFASVVSLLQVLSNETQLLINKDDQICYEVCKI